MTLKLGLSQPKLFLPPASIGTAALFIALIPISLAPNLVKLCEIEIGANAVIFHRAWIATVIFGLLSGLETFRSQKSEDQPQEKKPFTKIEIRLLLAMGTVGATYLLLWAWALTKTNVANVTLLSNLNSLFVGAAGFLLFGQRFDRRFLIGMFMAIVGALAFEFNGVQFQADQLFGDVLSLLTAIFMAAYLMLLERLRSRFSTATIMVWRCGVTAMLILPMLPLVEDRLFPYSWMGWFFVIFQSIFCQVFGQGLLTYSLSKLSSGVVAVTLLLEPVLASIFAWFIFSESITWFDLATFIFILVGIYLVQSSRFALKTTNAEL
ncbi:DMT family transporter [Kamptonema sp. UHCC 0994]|uniref:DMT family transporter n=1 Tax=Kamptonema sp. UHCC 0994 TaxID=3031329 RepID=UPI0023BA2F8E|nr:DMT family transporter [Kamptonema sp. UHCC 0994]MDF0555457.1 DMT family transporter [Kamptonema sp. UHCC 0994]